MSPEDFVNNSNFLVIQSSDRASLDLVGVPSSLGEFSGQIVFHDPNSTNALSRVATIGASLRGENANSYGLAFQTSYNGAPSTRMTISERGTIGIGTTHPEDYVNNDFAVVIDGGNRASLDLVGSPSGGEYAGQIVFHDPQSSNALKRVATIGAFYTAFNRNTYGLRFETSNDGPPVKRMTIDPDGAVTIGNSQTDGRLHVVGTTTTKVLEITGGSDLAEPFEMSCGGTIDPGTVVIIDSENPGKLCSSTEEYDTRVAGVVSGAGGIVPGLTLSQSGITDSGNKVALSGRVFVRASACNGPIKPGDLLTSSNLAGTAMKATDINRRHGAILGKAMSKLETGEGLVLLLINLH